MSRDELVLVAAVLGLLAGVGLIWSGWQYQPTRPRPKPARQVSFVAAIAAGSLVVVVSGWILPSCVVGAVAGWLASTLRRRRAGDDAGVERTDALASWVENVRDVLQSGNQPIGAIGATTETCPPTIRAQVLSLFARLSAGQPPEVAFRRFADEMDDPLADLVAIGLLIAVSRGAETEEVLSALAAQARHQADRRRVVEAERAPMRREVWMVSLVMCGLLVAVFAFARSSYLNAYDDAGGQLFLTLVLIGYGALLLWVGRLATFPRPSRFLTLRQVDS
jgi:Flp pilus assembly protein TadB